MTTELESKVFFIIGSGRSGTTLLAQMLNSHSAICVPHELQLLFEYSNNGARLLEVFESGDHMRYAAEDFITLVQERCPHRFEEYFDYLSFFRGLKYPVTSLNDLVGELFKAIASSRGKLIFGEQTPWYGQRIDVLHSLFPDARYIHMVRDGRDVALSFARTPWWHDDPLENLVRWDREVRAIEEQRELLSKEQFIDVRYEDLVENPELELDRICAHLGVCTEQGMLDSSKYIDYSQFSKINQRQISSKSLNEWKAQKQGATFSGSKFAWKKSDVFKDLALSGPTAETLKHYGYELPRNTWLQQLLKRWRVEPND